MNDALRFLAGPARARLHVPLLLAFFLILLASRRYWQLIAPQVWAEDGTANGSVGGSNLEAYVTKGWSAFFEPVNGYLIAVPKTISAISLAVSFSNYPLVSTILAWLFIALVGSAIVLAPTKLHGSFLCAATVFMIPSDPEVFGIPLYTFWWASLLLFLVALWDENRPSLGWRSGLLLLGGLSSPVIVMILPVLYFRAYWYRALRSERVIAVIASLIAAVQLYVILHADAAQSPPIASVLRNVIPAFFGKFLLGNLGANVAWRWFAGIGLTCIIAAWLLRDRRNVSAWILFYLLTGSIALTVTRVDPAIIDPRLAGPRYFFFPFVLTFWILIQYFHTVPSSWLRGLIGIVAVIAIVNARPALSRQHDDLRWADHVRSCRFFPIYTIPVQSDGNRSSAWSLRLPGETCTKLSKRDLLLSSNDDEGPTFAYSVLREHMHDVHDQGLRTGRLISSTMTGGDSQGSKLEGYRVISSFKTSDADMGEVLLELRRGEHVLYRSGPRMGGQSMSIIGQEQAFVSELPGASSWVILEFSNARLPAEFVVKIKDEGQGWGEWSAIAIRN